jgi:hypothetical protein
VDAHISGFTPPFCILSTCIRSLFQAEDTAFVFGEIFKAAPPEAQQVHEAILAYARKRPPIVNVRR